MNKKVRTLFKFKTFSIVLFLFCSLGILWFGSNAKAEDDEEMTTRAVLGSSYICRDRGTSFQCTLEGRPLEQLEKNTCDWGDPAYRYIFAGISSNWRAKEIYQIGIVYPCDYTVHDISSFSYSFNVSKDEVKNNYDTYEEANGFKTWTKQICATMHFYMRGEYGQDEVKENLDSYGQVCDEVSVVEMVQYTLTGVPIDEDGNEINSIGRVYSSPTNYGSSAQVTRIDASADDYMFLGWRDVPTGAYTQTSPTYTESKMIGDKTVYAVYKKLEKYVLTGIPVDTDGNEITAFPRVYSAPTKYGDTAQVTRYDASGDGYSFLGWRDVPTGAYTQLSQIYTQSPITGDKTVYAVYEKNTIQGKVDASSASGADTTGWTATNKTISHIIYNCPTSGCAGKFEHHLMAISGSGLSHYKILRSSDGSIENASVIKENDYSGQKGVDSVLMTNNMTLYPGDTVCETLTFDASYGLGNNNVNLTACILALGAAQEEELLTVKVKNNSVSKYNSYQDLVYAKPSDTLNFQGTYTPQLQYVYNMKPQKIQINDGTIYPVNGVNTTQTFGQLFNTFKGDVPNWNNAFSMRSDNFASGSFSTNYGGRTEDLGKPDKMVATNNHVVGAYEVGRELVVYAEMNADDTTKSSPTQIEFTNDADGHSVGKVEISQLERSVKAIVPYNFGTDITVTDLSAIGGNASAGLGGKININYTIDLTTKTNQETSPNSAYETMANDVRERIIFYVNNATTANNGGEWEASKDADICTYFGRSESNSICEVKKYTKSSVDRQDSGLESFIVPDRAAGSEVCVAVAVYPNSSGADTNTSTDGDGKWHVSKSLCYTVAKRPTFQVWGGSVYASNSIKTLSTTKITLSGSTLGNNDEITFSSWAEGSVIANGKVTGMASGAATGDSNSQVGNGSVESSLTNNKNYCIYRVPLSFANNSNKADKQMCPDGGEATGYSGVVAKDFDTDSLIDSLNNYKDKHANDENKEINVTINTATTDVTIEAQIIQDANVVVWKNPDYNVVITGNIKYSDGPYANVNKIPKAIIYAKNISINCDVARVDAILIAKDTINTCTGAFNNDSQDKINAEERQKVQLKINGALVAKTVIFSRTSGAGVGVESGTPAEIINYDTTIPLWQRNILRSDGYKTLTSVYQHEMAPRY